MLGSEKKVNHAFCTINPILQCTKYNGWIDDPIDGQTKLVAFAEWEGECAACVHDMSRDVGRIWGGV